MGHVPCELLHSVVVDWQQRADELLEHINCNSVRSLNIRQHLHEAGSKHGQRQSVRSLALGDERPSHLAEDVGEGRHAQLADQLRHHLHDLSRVWLPAALLRQGGEVLPELPQGLRGADLLAQLDQEVLQALWLRRAALRGEGPDVLVELCDRAGEGQLPAGLRQEAEDLSRVRRARHALAPQWCAEAADELGHRFRQAKLVVQLGGEVVEVRIHRLHLVRLLEDVGLIGFPDDLRNILQGLWDSGRHAQFPGGLGQRVLKPDHLLCLIWNDLAPGIV
mmetsp:Transcript_43193/g.124721  ORF Transcript_43193/g.124721 Transcript_43193/m.124721 type:complete len:278 (-) Transcript_43193:172-1005(-)